MAAEEIRKIDLHIHTTASDGTDAPQALPSLAREKGLSLIAITDHDGVKGGRAAKEARRAGDPPVLTGVEFSCRDALGAYHILGYGFDTEAEAIRRIVDRVHHIRMEKLARRLDFLAREYGFSFSEEEVQGLYGMENPGKPHLGLLMVRHGYAKSKEEAIDRYLNRTPEKRLYIGPEEAIAAILGGGGIPVLAHPAFGNGSQRIVGRDLDERLRRLADFGLRGLEAFYSGFPEALRDEALALAEKYHFYVTAGSDYHGTNKTVALGDTGLNAVEALPEGLMRFLEDVAR